MKMGVLYMPTERFFKIRNNKNQLFSTGGEYPSFKKNGKMWKSVGHLKQHLALVEKKQGASFYDGCEVVEYQMEPSDHSTVTWWKALQEKW